MTVSLNHLTHTGSLVEYGIFDSTKGTYKIVVNQTNVQWIIFDKFKVITDMNNNFILALLSQIYHIYSSISFSNQENQKY